MDGRDGLIRDDRLDFVGRGWAFPVGLDLRGRVALTTGFESIERAIRLILQTARGERVMRPDFGSGLQALVFEPLNTTTIALVKHRVETALITWEPRIRLRDVIVRATTDAIGCLEIDIEYEIRATNTFYNLVFPFYLHESRG